MSLLTSGIIAVLGTSIAIAMLRPLSPRLNLVDIPNQRKQHKGAIPLIGGISIFIGVVLSSLLTLPQDPILLAVLVCGVVIVVLGAIDDAKDISPWFRLGVQSLLIVTTCKFTGVSLHHFGNIIGIGDISVRWFDIVITVIGICGAINAYNMMDGIDGLAGSVAMISFIGLALLFHDKMQLFADFSQIFILALIPYLCVNLSLLSDKRKIFLGDAGSMLLGFAIGFMVIFGSQQTHQVNAFRPVTALWIIGLPLMDMVAIMMRRVSKGQSPLRADRNHLHHILMHAGFNQRESLSIIVIFSSLMMLVGVLGESYNIPEYIMMITFVFLFIVYCIGLKNLQQFCNRIKANHGEE